MDCNGVRLFHFCIVFYNVLSDIASVKSPLKGPHGLTHFGYWMSCWTQNQANRTSGVDKLKFLDVALGPDPNQSYERGWEI